MKQEVSICIFAGHTGGHLFPAIAYAESFKKFFPDSRITFITSPKAKTFLNSSRTTALDRVIFLNEFPFPKGISLRTLRFLLEFGLAFFYSFRFLSQVKPDLCVGFGSYVSYPGMRIASWKKIPTMIHEQNIIAGKATWMLAPHADLTVTSFEQTIFRKKPRSVTNGGLPLRSALYEAACPETRSFTEPASGKPLKIFITGGSQGAQRLNEVILASFSHLLPAEREKIAVTHITGEKGFNFVAGEYKKMNMRARVYPFFEAMQDLYKEADLAVTRAGANTLFELAAFGVPAIVVPFPHAAENHQELNARVFESRKAVEIKKEDELTPEWLSGRFRELMNPELRRGYSEKVRQMAPENAADKLVELSRGLLSKEGL